MNDKDTFVVAISNRRVAGRTTYFRHDDLAILRTYVAEREGIVVPES
jgi:hypothetical protein